ncbi:MAG: chemotaxis protein CheX [Lachnospiraceae bacterium]|nr:chemotaxis protein CheX [Lachnospiraceae bacterium]
MEFDVNVINPFLASAKRTTAMVAQIDLSIGKPYIRELKFDNEFVRIILGVTGAMTGQVIISMPEGKARDIASRMMMGMPVETLDDMAISAISELGNMIMGTAATILSENGVIIDITPPVVELGTVYMNMKSFQNVCVPLLLDNEVYMELNIIVKVKTDTE